MKKCCICSSDVKKIKNGYYCTCCKKKTFYKLETKE